MSDAVQLTTKTLLAAAPVTAIFGNRIYSVFAPQSAAFPHALVYLVHDEDPMLLTGSARWYNSRVSVEIRTQGDAPTLMRGGNAVAEALRDKNNYLIAGHRVTFHKEGSDVTDRSDETGATGNPSVVRRIIDFKARWRADPD